MNVGDRVELISMPSDPDPVPPGTQGTVDWVGDPNMFGDNTQQIGVAWDNGRSLIMIKGIDRFKKL
jgi:hypothetical protein